MASIHGLARKSSAVSTRQFVRRTEMWAAELRQIAGVDDKDRLDPRQISERFGVVIADLEEIEGTTDQDREHLRGVSAKDWSGSGIPLPNGKILVLLNPAQTAERANVTIMEEIAHSYLGHAPSTLVADADGLIRRSFDSESEREARWTAAAALLPSTVVARSVWERKSVDALSLEYGASVELIEFRIKVLGLWSEYRSKVTAA